MAIVLVGGGARSGKSSFAEQWAERRHGRATYLATAEARDEEMRDRIAHHRARRGAMWRTIEEPLRLAAALRDLRDEPCVLVDCLTLWLSNVMLDADRDAGAEVEALTAEVEQWGGADLVLVTNEAGCGVVPENALAREFRDLAGRLNQSMAAAADEVYWMVFGQPLHVKPMGEPAA